MGDLLAEAKRAARAVAAFEARKKTEETILKTAIFIVGGVMVGLAMVDLAFGNTARDPLPDVLSNHLDQQTDLLLAGAGAAALWLAYSQL